MHYHCLLVIYPFFSIKTLFPFKPDSVKLLTWMPKLFEFGFWQSWLMPPHKPDRTLKLCSSKYFSRKFTASKGIDQIDLIHSSQYPGCHELNNGNLSCKHQRTQQQPLTEVVFCTSCHSVFSPYTCCKQQLNVIKKYCIQHKNMFCLLKVLCFHLAELARCIFCILVLFTFESKAYTCTYVWNLQVKIGIEMTATFSNKTCAYT